MSSKTYFDQVAGEWDRMRQSFFSDRVRDCALDAAGVEPGRLAADVGAGTGFITEGLVRRGLRVIAVDQVEAMLEEMKSKFAAVDAIEYRVGEGEALPVDAGSCDYVFANMYLHHAERPALAIVEMARILNPGGRLVITDLDEHRFEFLRTEHHDRWMGFKREQVRDWFVQAGRREVSVDCVGESCCATSSCGCESAAVSIFVASGTKCVT